MRLRENRRQSQPCIAAAPQNFHIVPTRFIQMPLFTLTSSTCRQVGEHPLWRVRWAEDEEGPGQDHWPLKDSVGVVALHAAHKSRQRAATGVNAATTGAFDRSCSL